MNIVTNISKDNKSIIMPEEKRKMRSNTEEEYNKGLASDDPTKISKEDQESLAREAIKKFKSLS